MEPGRGGLSVLPLWPRTRRQGRGADWGWPGNPRVTASRSRGPRGPSRAGKSRRPPPPPPAPAPSPRPPRGPRSGAGGRDRPGAWGAARGPRGRRGCRLRSQLVPVRALGLGHRSDELVRFRFCSGSCRRARSPHDLSLASLLGAGALRPPPGSRPVSQPCCRPTRYEAVSFMDVNSTWRTVDRLSATACGCLG
nr:artemin [Camelus dromedarius]